MTSRLGSWTAIAAAVMVALVVAAIVAAAPALAQLPTPLLDNGAAGDGTGAAPLPGISIPIFVTLLFIGVGIGLAAVTIIRRWERRQDPDLRSRPRAPRDVRHPEPRR